MYSAYIIIQSKSGMLCRRRRTKTRRVTNTAGLQNLMHIVVVAQ